MTVVDISRFAAKVSTDPEAMKVRDWRHKLQKTFLSHKGNPKEEVSCSECFTYHFSPCCTRKCPISTHFSQQSRIMTTLRLNTSKYVLTHIFDLISIRQRDFCYQFSKIGKVMRHIAVLPDDKVPRNAEFKFKDRADALVKKWQQILNANKPANGPNTSESISAVAPLSAAPISATPGSQELLGSKDEDAAVTRGTAAISLNGKPVAGA